MYGWSVVCASMATVVIETQGSVLLSLMGLLARLSVVNAVYLSRQGVDVN